MEGRTPRAVTVSTDGYCAPNPGGRATWAFVARDAATGEAVAEDKGVAAETGGGSALAEYRAAYEALMWLWPRVAAGDVDAAELRCDHAGVVKVLTKASKVPADATTRVLAQECRRLTKAVREHGARLTFSRVPRHENKEADALASRAWGEAENGGRFNPG